MFCGRCGKQIVDNSQYCGYCGWEIDTAAAHQVAVLVKTAPPPVPQYVAVSPKRNNKTVIAAVTVVISLLVVALNIPGLNTGVLL